MTLTIHLSPDMERQLQEKARQQGQDTETVAIAILTEALEWEARDRAEAVEGIQRGIDDFEAGRSRPFADFAEEQRGKYNLPQDR